MKETSKIVSEAREAVVVVSTSLTHVRPRRRRRKVAVGLSFKAKRDVLEYREAQGVQKRVLLDDFTRLTGYHRTYAIWLFNHHTPKQQTTVRVRQRDYGVEVEELLVQVWNAANRLCSKLLIPSLPMFLDALERHGHLHLTQECRSRLLSMSTATADRLLRPHRQQEMRGLCTTRAGTLFKSTIPIRTFEQRDEQRPGFVEADLVAHCGLSVEGTYLFPLTLTDIATGRTECLPLLSKSTEAVLVAPQRARSLFPFPLLGLATDNGTEFINDALLTYCEQEHITFTRKWPLLKNDQWYALHH